MPGKSIVYRNIHIYRILVSILYGGKYKSRFRDVTNNVRGHKSVLELCFGDIWIARYCRDKGIKWIGYDLNSTFVNSARKAGHNAHCIDIWKVDAFPRNDLTIIQGSLYHFHKSIDDLFRKIFDSTNELLVSEPIRNLSSSPGLIGWLARRSANAGKGNEHFRYNEQTLRQMADRESKLVPCAYSIMANNRDMTLLFRKTSSS